jgi:SOS-response transcriptional repressor LexA
MDTCYKKAMTTDKPKKVLTVPVKLDEPTKKDFLTIAGKEDRPLGYVIRELALRGRALYKKDKGLKDISGGVPRAVRLKVVGRVSGGKPIEAVEDDGEIYVLESDVVGTHNARALLVKGDSMRDAGVLDGDIILVGDCESPINRIVVALIKDKGTVDTTLKMWRQKGNNVTLEPANPDYKPITYPAKKVSWYGALIKVLRTFPVDEAHEQSEADAA